MKSGGIPATVAARWRGLSLWARFALAAFVVVLIIGGVYFLKNKGSAAVTDAPHLRTVQVASVADLENDTTPLPLIGEVQSVNEAQIHTETAGAITHLYHKLGDYVPAGGIIAEIDNASERAALLSAQGSLEAAQASVQKSGKLFGESKDSALNTIKSVYSSNDDVVHAKLDVMFSNPATYQTHFVLTATNQSLLNKVVTERLQIEDMLAKESARAATLTAESDVKSEIAIGATETRAIKTYVDDLAALLNVSLPSQIYSETTISGFITTTSAARTTVAGSLASLTAASQALISAQTSGDTPEEASASDATLKQAQGSVAAANANLQKTIIRAPISGTLNNLTIHLGDFVSGFQQVAVVSNNGALQIVGHVSSEDRASISVGSKVKIENEYDGTITSIAPAIDPSTKKIEIKISFAGRANDLTNGQSVHLDIARGSKKKATFSTIMLPVATIKINAEGAVVFTVDENKHLLAHAVKTGNLVGDKIQVLSGVTPDMQLVTDARGLKDGQPIEIQ